MFDIINMGMQGYASTKAAGAAKEDGRMQQLVAEGEANQLEAAAKRGEAVASYNSDRVARRAKDIIATQRARAAAGGGDTTDATVTAITDETIREASMEQLLTMASAREAANQDRYAARVARETGIAQNKQAQSRALGTQVAAAGTIVSGLGNAWQDRYGA